MRDKKKFMKAIDPIRMEADGISSEEKKKPLVSPLPSPQVEDIAAIAKKLGLSDEEAKRLHKARKKAFDILKSE